MMPPDENATIECAGFDALPGWGLALLLFADSLLMSVFLQARLCVRVDMQLYI